eukprot:3846920-Prymnesium_polylepis.1
MSYGGRGRCSVANATHPSPLDHIVLHVCDQIARVVQRQDQREDAAEEIAVEDDDARLGRLRRRRRCAHVGVVLLVVALQALLEAQLGVEQLHERLAVSVLVLELVLGFTQEGSVRVSFRHGVRLVVVKLVGERFHLVHTAHEAVQRRDREVLVELPALVRLHLDLRELRLETHDSIGKVGLKPADERRDLGQVLLAGTDRVRVSHSSGSTQRARAAPSHTSPPTPPPQPP